MKRPNLRNWSLAAVGFGLTTLAMPHASATPIYLKPGQCVLVGTQDVCAMASDQAPSSTAKLTTLHLCRYALHPGAEIPNLKNHALFQVVTTETGSKSETLIRQFGINDSDRDACQKEADRLNGSPKP